MFIKSSTKTKPTGEKYKTHYLVEGYRDKKTKMPKHRYLSNLSSLPEYCILSLKTMLKSGSGEIDKVDLKHLEIIANKEFGGIKLFQKLYKEHFGKYFDKKSYNKALEAIVINKIFNPKSKNSLKNWLSTVDLGYKISNKNDLYECLDYLEKEQDSIEKRLSAKLKSEGCSILLYDITSTYFEGKGAENICKRGYSRDHRSDKVQVNIGLITSNDGTPISVEIISGNISDKQTLEDQIKKLKNKFGIEQISFVFDRGMKSSMNLEYLQQEGYEYITALSHSELRKLSEQNIPIQTSLFDKNDLSEFVIDDKYYSLVHNPYKAESDCTNREKLLSKTVEKLDKIQSFKRNYTPMVLQDKVSKIINKWGCQKFIDYNIHEEKVENKKIYGKLEYSVKQDSIENTKKYDGFYMIESSNNMIKGKRSVDQYKDLQLVERAFDSVKNHINIRPVFHYKESRIKGHIFSCFMSYFLLHKFKQKCTELLKDHSLDELLTELTKVQKNYLKIQNFCFEKITTLSGLASDIFKQFNINLLSPER